mgnify:CR=1 FL=1
MLKPDYFGHRAELIQHYDEIRVIPDDGSWVAYLIVCEVGRNWVRTKLLAKHELTPDTKLAVPSEDYEIQFKGPLHKFCVIRRKDAQILKEGLNKADAQMWLLDYQKNN